MESIIVKYLTHTISDSEIELLKKWLEKPDNRIFFESYIKVNFELDEFFFEEAKEELYQQLIAYTKPTKVLGINKVLLKYAAVFIGVLTSMFGVYKFGVIKKEVSEETVVSEITLQLEDGSYVVLNEEKEDIIKDAKGNNIAGQKGSAIYYNDSITIEEKLVYNTLTVPHGKRFELVLSDNTHVHLNAGTTLKYPKKFIKGLNREVFLNGEAFFDVHKDSLHPFNVIANDVNVEVLGTKFNISSYEEDQDIKTVLVEGSVQMFGDNFQEQKTVLVPGEKGAWSKTEHTIKVEEVDTYLYTGWIAGELIFRDASFGNMRRKLERSYNVKIQNNNNRLEATKFNASLHIDLENIDEVLSFLSKLHEFSYEIKDNNITIN